MKKLIMIASLFLTACADVELPAPEINLGANPTNKTNILSVMAQGTKITVMYNLTTGAKYSVQVYEFGQSDPTKTLPLTAEEEIVTRVYDLADLPDGLYDITLTDVAGVSIKKPLIIKR